jgi:propionyl-CoA carboxylase alpha chain
MHGHAVECRVYAEDVAGGFLPDPGVLVRHRPPSGPGIRVDSGVEEGDEVPIHYDPMIAKVTAWAATREMALNRMSRALAEYDIAGVRTTIPFCLFVVEHPAFRSGDFDTGFVDEHFAPAALAPSDSEVLAAVVSAATGVVAAETPVAENDGEPVSRWALRRGNAR